MVEFSEEHTFLEILLEPMNGIITVSEVDGLMYVILSKA